MNAMPWDSNVFFKITMITISVNSESLAAYLIFFIFWFFLPINFNKIYLWQYFSAGLSLFSLCDFSPRIQPQSCKSKFCSLEIAFDCKGKDKFNVLPFQLGQYLLWKSLRNKLPYNIGSENLLKKEVKFCYIWY